MVSTDGHGRRTNPTKGGIGYMKLFSGLGIGMCENGIVVRITLIMSRPPPPESEMGQRQGRESTCPKRCCCMKGGALAGGVRSQIHIRASFREHAEKFRQHRCF